MSVYRTIGPLVQCSIFLVVKGALVLICIDKVISLGFLDKFPTCIVFNKIIIIKLIQFMSLFCYFQNTLLYGFIFGQYYLISFFLNEFNSHCVSKLHKVSNIIMIKLKLYSYVR